MGRTILTMTARTTWKAKISGLCVATGLILASSSAALAAPKEVGSYKDWKAYASSESGGKVCFVLSTPKDKSPKNVARGDIFFIVTNWGDGHWQPSIEIGYPFKPSSKATVKIGSDKFNLFTDNDKTSGNGGAFLRERADETRIVRAMKRGSSMIIKGTSKRGTLTTDRYSLSGITAALDAAAKACK
jgi:invasion associated locus B (IalB) protein